MMLLCLSYAFCMIEVFELYSIYICPMMKNSPVDWCFCFLVFSLHLYCHTYHHQYAAAAAAASSSSSSSSSSSCYYYYYYYYLLIGFGRGGSGRYSYCHKRCWMAFKENHKFHRRWIVIAMRSEGWSLVNFLPWSIFFYRFWFQKCYILSGYLSILLYFIPLHLFYIKFQIMIAKYAVKVMVTICMFA